MWEPANRNSTRSGRFGPTAAANEEDVHDNCDQQPSSIREGVVRIAPALDGEQMLVYLGSNREKTPSSEEVQTVPAK
jgi:hypothetical protein